MNCITRNALVPWFQPIRCDLQRRSGHKQQQKFKTPWHIFFLQFGACEYHIFTKMIVCFPNIIILLFRLLVTHKA